MGNTEAFDLTGKVCLATAACQGVGRGVALGLAQAGADVAVADINPRVSETADAIRAMGRRSLALTADLRRRDEAERVVAAVIAEFGYLDVLYNGVGGMRRPEDNSYYEVDPLELTEAELDETFALTVKSALFCSIAAARQMIKQGGGRIINTTSGYATEVGPGRLPYSVSKAGVSIMTRNLAMEWGKHNILVNEISPFARTGATAERMADPEASARMLSRVAVGRFAEPEEMAGAVVFLASAAASYVNGITITINGGRTR